MVLTDCKIVTSGFQYPTVLSQRPNVSRIPLIRIGTDGTSLDALEKMLGCLRPLKYTDAIAQALVGSGRRWGREPEIAGRTLVMGVPAIRHTLFKLFKPLTEGRRMQSSLRVCAPSANFHSQNVA